MTDLNSSGDEKTQLAITYNANDSAAVDMDVDDSTVKFIPNGGKMEHEEKRSEDMSFSGLGKEELLKYADDPFWKKVRIGLFIAFWLGWLGMLVAAIIIIVLAPRCPYRPDQKWFDKETVYQVYPKSFKDSTPEDVTDPAKGAGVGDLKGMKSKIGYFEDIGTKSIYISSFYKSDHVDGSMGVVDHKAIDKVFGTMSDFDALRKDTKKKGMHLILDFIPNHTSDEHEWFIKSKKKEGKYTDYYVWAKCKQSTMPSNWLSVNGGSAWKYDSDRDECYLHQQLSSQPDLNLRNPDVKDELESILKFWLDKGVDGFNVIGAEYLLESNDTSVDEPESGIPGTATTDYAFLKHTHTSNQRGNAALLASWRAIAEEYNTKPGREKLLMVGVNGGFNDTAIYGDKAGATFILTRPVVNFNTSGSLAEAIRDRIQMYAVDNKAIKAWTFGDQNSRRLANVAGKSRVKSMLALQMLLPGVPVNYYGNELGMADGDNLGQNATDKDPYRTPMQWDSSNKYAGFSDHKPWLPVNSNYQQVNVAAQKGVFSNRIQDKSALLTFKQLVELRGNESFQWGETKVGVTNNILWFTRKAAGFPGYLTMINFGNDHQTPPIVKTTNVPKDVQIVFHSHFDVSEQSKVDLKKSSINVDANHVVVLKYEA